MVLQHGPSPYPIGLRFRVLPVPHLRAVCAQFQDFGRTRHHPRGFRTSWAITKLRTLRWVVREERFGFALSHPPNRARESTRVSSICPLVERPGTRGFSGIRISKVGNGRCRVEEGATVYRRSFHSCQGAFTIGGASPALAVVASCPRC